MRSSQRSSSAVAMLYGRLATILRGASRQRGRIERQRVALDQLEPAGIARRQLAERGETARVALDRDDAPRAFRQQRAGQPARSRTDLDHGRVVEPPGGARDAPGQVQVEDEILPEALARRDAVARDDLAQRRQAARIGASLPHLPGDPRRAPSLGHLGGQPQRGDQAVGPGRAAAGDVESGAVIGRGADERQAQRHVDRRRRNRAS